VIQWVENYYANGTDPGSKGSAAVWNLWLKAPDGSQRSIHGSDLKKLSRIELGRSLEELKARYRELNRALADERLPESEANALRRERDQVQAEIGDGPDGAARREMAAELRRALVDAGW
jgi:hypothetical protein